MVVSRQRRVPSNGTVAVAIAIDSSPWVEAYKFDQATGFTAKYSAPSTIPSITNSCRGITFAPGNRLLLGGSASSVFYNYPFDAIAGFGTPATTAYTNPVAFHVNAKEDAVLVSGDNVMAEYDYASGAVGSLRWSIAATGFVSESQYAFGDKYAMMGFTATNTYRFYGPLTGSTPALKNSSAFYGLAPYFFLSPLVLADGSQTLSFPTNAGYILQRATDGVGGALLTDPSGSLVLSAIFDPYGRLITYETTAPKLRIYTQASTGVFTQLDTDAGLDLFGTATKMAYDEDQDILFIGSGTAPYLQAYRMGGNGFVSKYDDPVTAGLTAVTDGVNKVAILYDEKWKNFSV
jgi:hypothetical protein